MFNMEKSYRNKIIIINLRDIAGNEEKEEEEV